MITHNAPPVVYPLGRSRFQAMVLTVLWFAGLLAIVFWLIASRSTGWHALLAAAALAFAGVTALRSWKNSPIGELVWDGQIWRWESQGYQTGVAEQALFVIADFQSLLLLRLENQAHASLWLWAEQNALPERWLNLRRAVHSSQRAVDASGRSGFRRAQTADVEQAHP